MRVLVLTATVALGLVLPVRGGETPAKTAPTPEMKEEYKRLMTLPDAERPAAIAAFQKKHGLTPAAAPDKGAHKTEAAGEKAGGREPSPEMKAEYLRIKALPEDQRGEALKEFNEAHPPKDKARRKKRSMQDDYALIMELPEPERGRALKKMHAKYGLHDAPPKER